MTLRLALSIVAFSISAVAAQKTWTGQITDSMCGANHAAMGDMGKNPKDCAAACVKSGAKYAFVSDGKVFDLANQDFSDLKVHAGQSVTLTGELTSNGKAITISKLAPKK
jgi:hypothetical protein